MDVAEYLQGVRDKYVESYRSVLRSKREDGAQCSAEVWVDPAVPPGEPKPPHPLCVDILVQAEEKPEMIMVSGEVAEGPLVGTLRIGQTNVKVYAAAWEACPVWFRHPDPDLPALDEWKKKWMDVNRGAGEDGLSHVVHYLGHPTAEGGGSVYVVDFGSAPVDALMELLEALAAMGATEMEVGLSDGSDLPADVQAELKQPDLDIAALTAILARLVGELDGVERVEQLSEAEFAVYTKDSKQPTWQIYTGNLHQALLRAGIEARARDVYRFVRAQRESMAPETTSDLSQLRLVMKDDRFLEHIRQLGPDMKPLVKQKLAADMWLVCVWDAPNGMRFTTQDEPEKYGLTQQQVLDRARDNYLKARPEVELAEDGLLWVAQTGDCYDATLLVDDDWWEERQSTVKGELLACAPARHVVLIGDSSRRGTIGQMRRAAQRIEAGGDHLVSSTILCRRDGQWVPLEPEPTPGQPAAQPRSDPPPKQSLRNKPWWKFW